MRAPSHDVGLLLDVLDEAFDHRAWHGPNLRGALRGVSAAQAAWRPARGRHSIWELALHCAYWKYAVCRRLVGGPRGSFPRRPSNFPAPPLNGTPADWKADLALLEDQHRRLREAVGSLAASGLRRRRGHPSPARLIYGVAAHDLYHAGQIRLLLTLSATARRRLSR
jgi:uncharacterized damage-inducible protein DinB